jgi:hypothetical protein
LPFLPSYFLLPIFALFYFPKLELYCFFHSSADKVFFYDCLKTREEMYDVVDAHLNR